MATKPMIERLLNAAFDVLHHDVSEDSAAGLYERDLLRRKFEEILANQYDSELTRRKART